MTVCQILVLVWIATNRENDLKCKFNAWVSIDSVKCFISHLNFAVRVKIGQRVELFKW